MSENPFYKLAPFIREYIYSHGWTELREVQVEACRILFETDDHLLLATGTASGKTEAAFLPILTVLHEKPTATLGALYIGPLKALINDQFVRLRDLLQDARIPVWHWHGDVPASHKNKLLRKPRGVLQITPESMESLLINRNTELMSLFADLRFVVIDEVHAFMGSDRGRQVLCQLGRLAKYMRAQPRRVGLSATLGDYSLAEKWLQSGTDRTVRSPRISEGKRSLRLALEHFELSEDDASPPEPHGIVQEAGEVSEPAVKATPVAEDYYRYLYDSSRARKKCLIFANNRADTETVIASLRQIARRERTPDIYHVHHGSISAPLREAAEEAMRRPHEPAVVAATITLELGIDIGQLERIIQLSAPFSVSSFVQRLGRSGRRGSPSEMWFVCRSDRPTSETPLPDLIPWVLLQCIAIIQLYLEEHWIEPILPPRYPFSLLYHQTMSTLASAGELSPAALAQRVLTLEPFRTISEDDYRKLLQHLISIDHIQQMPTRGLIIGLAGEKIVRHFRFYAVFPDVEEYTVREEAQEIGSIMSPPPPGERFSLAGRTWEVLEVDLDRRCVFVRKVEGKAAISWHGGGGDVHSRILNRMRQVLFEEKDYPYLQPAARQRLAEARSMAKSVGLDESNILHLGGNRFCVFPWLGTVACRTLDRLLRQGLVTQGKVWSVNAVSPYYLMLQGSYGNTSELLADMRSSISSEKRSDHLLTPGEIPIIAKYDEFIPADLLRKAFASDYLDVTAVERAIGRW